MNTDKAQGRCIRIRAHHLPNLREYALDGVRLHWDESCGYTTAFARAHDAVLAAVVSDPTRPVRIVAAPDDICECGVCPKKMPECASPSLAETDRSVAALFGAVVDKEYAAQEVVALATRPVLDLGNVALKSGEHMKIRLVSPPAPEYAERLKHFLDHKPDWAVRKIRKQLNGDYRNECVDKFFVGEVEGRLAGHVWYGYPIAGSGTANFGEVYTAPEHRRKGVADELVRFLVNDFHNSPARLALCTADELATRIYAKHGFRTVIPNAQCGPLILLKARFGSSFAEYAETYYRPGQPVSVVAGSVKHRHDIDCMLRFSHILRSGTDVKSRLRAVEFSGASLAGRVGPAWHVPNYMEACFQTDGGRGFLTVAALPEGKVAGWAFALRREAPLEAVSWTFDFELHPAYLAAAPLLIRDTLRMARAKGIADIFAWCAASQAAKLEALAANGFAETARVPRYCDGATCDLVVLRAAR
jgi:GNAT superfamily N-acetyltransferase